MTRQHSSVVPTLRSFAACALVVGMFANTSCSNDDSHKQGETLASATEALVAQDSCSVTEGIVDVVVHSDTMPSLALRQTFTSGGRNVTPSLESRVTLGQQQILLWRVENQSDQSVKVTLEYDGPFSGIDSAVLTLKEGVVSGTINGREIRAVEVASGAQVVFADGTPIPELKISGSIEAKMVALFRDEAANLVQSCAGTEAAAAVSRMSAPTALQALRGTPGHESEPELSLGCIGCVAGCDLGYLQCLESLATASLACGPFAPLCVVGSVVVCSVALYGCVSVCDATLCCPTECGSSCCESNETCLNGVTGLCCSEGLQACNGQRCCESGDACMDSGECCPSALACGDVCCADDQTGTRYCLDPTTNTCCSTLQERCNGKCCAVGEFCGSGGECVTDPIDRPTEEECIARSLNGPTCTVITDCPVDGNAYNECAAGCCVSIR